MASHYEDVLGSISTFARPQIEEFFKGMPERVFTLMPLAVRGLEACIAEGLKHLAIGIDACEEMISRFNNGLDKSKGFLKTSFWPLPEIGRFSHILYSCGMLHLSPEDGKKVVLNLKECLNPKDGVLFLITSTGKENLKKSWWRIKKKRSWRTLFLSLEERRARNTFKR